MITESCQRWELGREHRRPAGEVARAADYEVAPITGAAAKDFVSTHHYAGSCSPPAHPFGLHRTGGKGELVGVAVFGPLPSMNAHRAVFPSLSTTEAFTLGRLVLLDEVPGNGESLFVSRCFALLRAQGVIAIESCADPEPRMALDRTKVHRGHVGCVYQATNGRYVGRTNPATLRLLPDGRCFSNRAAGKIVRAEQGRAYAGSELVDFGATPLAAGEDPQVWIDRWRTRLTRPMRHQGNHRYLWILDPRRRRELTPMGPDRAYPKIGWDPC